MFQGYPMDENQWYVTKMKSNVDQSEIWGMILHPFCQNTKNLAWEIVTIWTKRKGNNYLISQVKPFTSYLK